MSRNAISVLVPYARVCARAGACGTKVAFLRTEDGVRAAVAAFVRPIGKKGVIRGLPRACVRAR